MRQHGTARVDFVRRASGSVDGARMKGTWLVALLGLAVFASAASAVTPETAEVTDTVFFEIEIGGKPMGKITLGLFGGVAPKTVANFVALSNGFDEENQGFKDTVFHRVIADFMIQGGAVRGKQSLYGGSFPDETFALKHEGPGLLSMANAGPNTNSCQFFITTVPCPHLDGHHVVFGKVLSGMDVVKTIEHTKKDAGDRPEADVKIVDCGASSVKENRAGAKAQRSSRAARAGGGSSGGGGSGAAEVHTWEKRVYNDIP